jgi:predicted amidohydrolase YtcJ
MIPAMKKRLRFLEFLATLALACSVLAAPVAATGELVVFVARQIVTMEPGQPVATAVAVRDGLIVDVGSLESLQSWIGDAPHRVDRRFEKKVLLPGFIEPHVHPFLAGKLLTFDIAAPERWNLPKESVDPMPDRESFVDRVTKLSHAWTDPSTPHIVWGWHRLWHGDFSRQDLDAIAADKPLILWHRSYHEIVANSAALEWMNLSEEEVAEAGDQIDLAKGHFMERGMSVASRRLSGLTESPEKIAEGLSIFSDLVRRGGVTTVADLVAGSTIGIDREWDAARAHLQGESIPYRSLFIAAPFAWFLEEGEGAYAHHDSIRAQANEQLRWPKAIKTLADGAFISQLMQLTPPGYLDGHEGQWIVPPELQLSTIQPFWDRGFDIYYHVNGDKGLDQTLDVFEALLTAHPREDFRFSLEHFGVSREDQVTRLAHLGASVSINGYYLNLFGDQYARHGLGYSRASQMTRLGSLARAGVRFTMHSDCPMGPIEPLLAVTNAVTRRTIEGAIMAPEQAVSVDAALRAVTIDAAWSLRLDHEVGSIAVGKKADFVVLEKNPYDVRPSQIRDIPIWGTVYEGRVFEAP